MLLYWGMLSQTVTMCLRNCICCQTITCCQKCLTVYFYPCKKWNIYRNICCEVWQQGPVLPICWPLMALHWRLMIQWRRFTGSLRCVTAWFSTAGEAEYCQTLSVFVTMMPEVIWRTVNPHPSNASLRSKTEHAETIRGEHPENISWGSTIWKW